MKIGLDNALGVHPEALSLRAQRTQLLANNIANADTPGFKAKDIDFYKVLQDQTQQMDRSVNMRTTHTGHQAANDARPISEDAQYRVPLMPTLDGNTVDGQIEQTEFTQNSMQFLTSLRVLNGRFNGLLTAIRGE